MKINLLLDNDKDILSGYLNIDPFANGQDSRMPLDVTGLDDIVDDGEAEEIIAKNILEYFPIKQIDSIINNWVKKVKIGGKITVGIVDYDEVCRLFLLGFINTEQMNLILYGSQEKDWEFKKCALTEAQISSVLQSKGLKLIHSRLDGANAVVTLQRI